MGESGRECGAGAKTELIRPGQLISVMAGVRNQTGIQSELSLVWGCAHITSNSTAPDVSRNLQSCLPTFVSWLPEGAGLQDAVAGRLARCTVCPLPATALAWILTPILPTEGIYDKHSAKQEETCVSYFAIKTRLLTLAILIKY